MKKILIIVFVSLFLIPASANAYAPPELEGEDEFNERVSDIMSGRLSLKPSEVVNMLMEDMTREIRASGGELLMIAVLAAVSGITAVLSDSFGSRAGGEAAFFAGFALMSASAVQCFTTALSYGVSVIEALNSFITKLSPLLMLMLALCGDTASASVFHPVLSGAVYMIAIMVRQCLVPMVCFSATLAVAGNISGKLQISNFCRVVKSVSKWIMTAMITIFTGISSIYGFSAPAMDALSAKTVKFAAGSLVPVVGSFVSGTLDTVISGSRLMKNAVGAAGMLVMCGICIVPVVKIGVIQLMLKLAAALSEPVTDKRISGMLWQMSEACASVFGMVIMTVVLYIINISIILAATSFTL